MKKFVISENILVAVLQYLETRPFAEVAKLHSAINADIKELEGYKMQEVTEATEKERQNTEMKQAVKNKIIEEYLAGQKTETEEEK